MGLHLIAERLVACIVPILSTRAVLWPEEELLLDGVTLRRRTQFGAGRDAARRAIAALGGPSVCVGQGAGGEPLFPETLRGSISHTGEHAVALVGDASVYRSLGVDIDDHRALGDAAAAGVTWQTEVARIQRVMDLPDRADAQNFAFSAKEAIFKCQYPLTFDAKLRALQARLLEDDLGPGQMIVAGWRVSTATADVLKKLVVRRLSLDGATLALSILAAPPTS